MINWVLQELRHQLKTGQATSHSSRKTLYGLGDEVSIINSKSQQPCERLRIVQSVAKLSVLGISVAITLPSHFASAQIIPDTTLGDESSFLQQNGIVNDLPAVLIDGGAEQGINLFHSFLEFNVGNGQRVYFNNPVGIENILSRVTGNNLSSIFGTLGVTGGTANLFLINPNGIIFGAGTTLDLGGSFVGTTANAIQFPDGNTFSASEPNFPSPTLTVNPSAFLFNQIANQSTSSIEVTPGTVLSVGAEGNPRSLLLVGGNVFINGSTLEGVDGSRVEVAGFTGEGSVGLTIEGSALDLIFPFNGVVGADVTLNQALINVGTIANDADGILLVGGTVSLTNGSQLSSSAFGEGDAGLIYLQADNVFIDNSSLFSTAEVGASGDAGGILIEAESVLLSGAILDTTNSGSGIAGDMVINARNQVSLINSEITSQSGNEITDDFGFIAISSTEGSVLLDQSTISTTNFGSGFAGDISIAASDEVSILNQSGVFSRGNFGRIYIGESEEYSAISPNLVAIDNSTLNSDNSSYEGPGSIDAGGISVTANDLVSITNGTQLSSSTLREGGAGAIFVQTNGGDVSISGSNTTIFTTVESGGIGTGGNIQISTDSLSLSDGAQLQTLVRGPTTLDDGTVIPGGVGDAGVVFVQATDVSLSGLGSAIFSTIEEGGSSPNASNNDFAGNIFSALFGGGDPVIGSILIYTDSLSLTDGAELNSSTFGTGNAGGVLVLASGDVSVSNNSKIASGVAETGVGNGGAILIGAESLEVENSGVTTSTFGDGFAGLIVAATNKDVVVAGADSGIFSIADSDSPNAAAGGIAIEGRSLYITDGGTVTVNNQAAGEAGGIFVEVYRDIFILNGGTLSATTLSGEGGDIDLITGDFLVLGDNGNISTTAGLAPGGGNGGNINISSPYVISAPLDDNNITAQAYTGDGGRIEINTNRLYAIARRDLDFLDSNDITASSRFGINGIEEINSVDIDPTQGLTNLPANPVDPSSLIAQNCTPRSRDSAREENKFTITGRGGLPPNPNSTLQSESVVINWVEGDQPVENPTEEPTSATPESAIPTTANVPKTPTYTEAQGWVIGEKGEVVLTAQTPTVTPHNSSLTSAAICNGS